MGGFGGRGRTGDTLELALLPSCQPAIGRHPEVFPITHANCSTLWYTPSFPASCPPPHPKSRRARPHSCDSELEKTPPLDRKLRGEIRAPPRPPPRPKPGTNPKLTTTPRPHRAWKSKQFKEEGDKGASGSSSCSEGRRGTFHSPQSPLGLKQSVQDLSLKISWRCLSGCVNTGSSLSSAQLYGLRFSASWGMGWLRVNFPLALPPPFQAWGSCQ